MSTTTPTTSAGQQFLTLLKNDALLSFGPPLLTFLTNVSAAGGDPIKLTAAWVQLQGNAIEAAPTALAGLESQLATLIATKLQAAIAKV